MKIRTLTVCVMDAQNWPKSFRTDGRREKDCRWLKIITYKPPLSCNLKPKRWRLGKQERTRGKWTPSCWLSHTAHLWHNSWKVEKAQRGKMMKSLVSIAIILWPNKFFISSFLPFFLPFCLFVSFISTYLFCLIPSRLRKWRGSEQTVGQSRL